MGSRHNRKRTRSRPRNRKNLFNASAVPQMMFSGSTFAHPQSPFSSTFPDSNAFAAVPQLSIPSVATRQYQERHRQQRLLQNQRHEAAMEHERLRMFGGEMGDSVSLCAPMLRVVMDLFEGNVDYEDP